LIYGTKVAKILQTKNSNMHFYSKDNQIYSKGSRNHTFFKKMFGVYKIIL